MKQKDILLILVPTFIMVILWIAFSVYHSHVSSTITEPLNKQINPIGENFDLEALNSLKKRVRFEPIYEIPENLLSEPGDETLQTEVSSPPAELLNEENVATEGAEEI